MDSNVIKLLDYVKALPVINPRTGNKVQVRIILDNGEIRIKIRSKVIATIIINRKPLPSRPIQFANRDGMPSDALIADAIVAVKTPELALPFSEISSSTEAELNAIIMEAIGSIKATAALPPTELAAVLRAERPAPPFAPIIYMAGRFNFFAQRENKLELEYGWYTLESTHLKKSQEAITRALISYGYRISLPVNGDNFPELHYL